MFSKAPDVCCQSRCKFAKIAAVENAGMVKVAKFGLQVSGLRLRKALRGFWVLDFGNWEVEIED